MCLPLAPYMYIDERHNKHDKDDYNGHLKQADDDENLGCNPS